MNRDRIEAFLRENRLLAACYDGQACLEHIADEIEAGLAGQKSPLPMLPTYITLGGRPAADRPVIVIDAGGTNLRSALAVFRNGKLELERFTQIPMPGSGGVVLSRDAFFDAIADTIVPLCDSSELVSFCFSYPFQSLPDHDGIAQALCKDVRVDGIEGRLLNDALAQALRRRGIQKEMQWIVLNDSVAGLVGGAVEVANPDDYDGCIGLIVGTGFNICYEEKTDKIQTVRDYNAPRMAINTELGYSNAFAGGIFDEELDAASDTPGFHLADKKISGAYLGKLMARVFAALAKEGLLEDAQLAADGELPLAQASAFLQGQGMLWERCADNDRETVGMVIRSLYDRAAFLAACLTVAAALRVAGDKKRVAVLADGSTLLKCGYMLEAFCSACHELGEPHGVVFDVIPSPGATLSGTAAAALAMC